MEETEHYFSGEHHLYGIETEISVPPKSQAISMSRTHPRSIPDVEIFRNNVTWHSTCSKPNLLENKFLEKGELREEHWHVG